MKGLWINPGKDYGSNQITCWNLTEEVAELEQTRKLDGLSGIKNARLV